MHLRNIFNSGELDEFSVSSILEHTASDGKTYQTQFYNLDDTVYHIGASLKDLGKKWFAFSRMEINADALQARMWKDWQVVFHQPARGGTKIFFFQWVTGILARFFEWCGGFAEAPYLCLSGDPYLLVSRPRSAMVETRVFLEGRPGSFFGGIGRWEERGQNCIDGRKNPNNYHFAKKDFANY